MVVTPPWGGAALALALDHARQGDVLLLAQEAASLACAEVALDPALQDGWSGLRVYVLTADLVARGLGGAALREGCVALDDAGWVALVVDCGRVATWS
jgi:tRNA 2-thiouridine synthesizing protein B